MTNTIAERPLNNEMFRLFIPRDTYNPTIHGPKVKKLTPTPTMLKGVATLKEQLNSSPRKLIITTGNYPLWALTGVTGADIQHDKDGRPIPNELKTWAPNGIMNWRGSMWYDDTFNIQLLPIVHPAAIMRQWPLRAVTVHDLKARVPMALRGDWRPNPMPIFWAPPTFEQAKLKLEFWLRRAQAGHRVRLTNDIETHKQLITCIGFADSVNFAMCIPFIRRVPSGFESWWPTAQEIVLTRLITQVLKHPNILVEGQNYIYDTQYIQHWMCTTPNLDFDTMLAHHLLWPGTPKALDYQSSLYCQYHWYWKEDGKEWAGTGTVEDQLVYNCWDCVRTFECATSLRTLIPQLGQTKQWEQTMRRNGLALRMMNRGVRIDTEYRGKLALKLAEVLSEIDAQLEAIIPSRWLPPPSKGSKNTPWYRSPKKQLWVFGEFLGMRMMKHRKTGNYTMGKDAIDELPKKYPEFAGVFSRLKKRRSVAVFKSHFVDARIDPDKRMRCSFNPAGTETFRWSSSTNALGRGTNLQNIPVGDEE